MIIMTVRRFIALANEVHADCRRVLADRRFLYDQPVSGRHRDSVFGDEAT